MRPILALVVACGSVLISAGCSRDTTSATSSPRLTDSDLERAITNRFANDPQLADVKVSANADKNEATLSGTVVSENHRTRAVDLAKAAAPNLVVTDKIDVKPREVSRSEYTEDMARQARGQAEAAGDKIGKSIDDAWLHTKITSKLLTGAGTTGFKINVDVQDKVVTLRGKVDSLEAKQRAEQLARDTEGVARVINRLTVSQA
jgi:osmotically-inducible protein OsmY